VNPAQFWLTLLPQRTSSQFAFFPSLPHNGKNGTSHRSLYEHEKRLVYLRLHKAGDCAGPSIRAVVRSVSGGAVYRGENRHSRSPGDSAQPGDSRASFRSGSIPPRSSGTAAATERAGSAGRIG